MHVIIGGAYNGKRKYIAKQLEGQAVDWCDDLQHSNIENEHAEILVITDLEKQIEPFLNEPEKEVAETFFNKIVKNGFKYKSIYVIIEDIGRGVVPIFSEKRKLRDVLGRLYQLLFAESQTITRIWYGIPQKIK